GLRLAARSRDKRMIEHRECRRSTCTSTFSVRVGEGLVGRPRIWCSDDCRRLASEERRAAASGAIVTKYVVQELSLDAQAAAVLESPAACRRVIRQLGRRFLTDDLAEAKWGSVDAEFRQFLCASRIRPRRR
ncbi:MAG: hypothetical protein ACRDRN_18695, partial [Sciscionella sp.]